jgi:glycosyltransferase involved in cell wall biosynthesis
VHADARSSPALIVVGDGPLAEDVRDAAETMPGIRCEGRQPRERVLELMGRARALVFPSLCYENSPAVVAEAFARGLPVLATRLGSTAEIVREGSTGRLFAAGDARGLADLVEWALAPSTELSPVRLGARAAFHANHTAEGAMSRLLDIYAAARARRDAEHPG